MVAIILSSHPQAKGGGTIPDVACNIAILLSNIAADFESFDKFGLDMSEFGDKQIRPSTRAVIKHGDEILLLKDTSDLAEGFVLPGGGIEFAESARQALKREIKEEVGIELAIGRFLGCFEQGFLHWKFGLLHDLSLLFLIEISAEQRSMIASQEERWECAWIEIHELHRINLLPTELKELIPFWLSQDLDAAFKGSFQAEIEAPDLI